MRRIASLRALTGFSGPLLGAFVTLLILLGLAGAPSSQVPSASITVEPDKVDIGTTATVTLFSSGFFDLSEVNLSQVGIRPKDDVSSLRIESATAQRMKLSFKISSEASVGVRTLFIKDRKGTANVVALDLAFKLAPHVCRPACAGHTSCKNNRCEPDPTICTPACGACQRCVANSCRPLTCNPPCNKDAIPPEACECGICVKLR
jgi:hypothetical protein